ncbi:MAG: UDP-N-acetylmuramate:L-alanyl-gamma-D-glutamyl-meso-diaminopimelate ligase [Burkholderiaceae bacterium]|nr:UDP-N-acetylmuramate:L-alanyl-gamma-D-glutamyl-meso-diaminopimelate ligase [Burkholderiaceae bacterium]
MHIHILGICGTFMGGIAAIATQAGHCVTGCDANVYPPMSEQLRALGIELIEGYDAAQRSLAPDLWVVGNVVSRGNPLMEAILDARDPFTSGPQWLAEHALGKKWVLAVAGTHGKTTTASLLAWILEANGRKPGFLIGGVARNFPVSARLGEREHFVIEADEYDTAFFDKRSKFVHYRSRTLLLNNLEFDHADIFADLAAIETQFHHLVRTVARSGRIIHNAAEPALARVLARGLWSESESFLSAEGWHLDAIEDDGSASSFDVHFGGERLGRCRVALAGAHNRANALAAIAAARHAGVAPAAAIDALAAFEGVRRRLETRGTAAGVTVIDDFAHHPTAIATTVAGLRERVGPQARILAVLEPRSNTMKLGTMAAQLPDSLRQADLVYCHAAGLDWDVAGALTPLGARARVERDLAALVRAIVSDACAGDYVLAMSNGSFGGIHQRLLDALAGREKEQPLLNPADEDGVPRPRPPAARTAGRLVYLHGFRSSPQSFKARILDERLRALGLAERFVCPQLPPSPAEAVALVEREIAPGPDDTLVGSSLGGYYATWLAERSGARAVLLNPAIDPARDLAPYVGELRGYHDDRPFRFEARHLDELRALHAGELRDPARWLLVAAKGDEVLDWREMLARYPGARAILLEGGDHGLTDFDSLADEVLGFAGFDARAANTRDEPKD